MNIIRHLLFYKGTTELNHKQTQYYNNLSNCWFTKIILFVLHVNMSNIVN